MLCRLTLGRYADGKKSPKLKLKLPHCLKRLIYFVIISFQLKYYLVNSINSVYKSTGVGESVFGSLMYVHWSVIQPRISYYVVLRGMFTNCKS